MKKLLTILSLLLVLTTASAAPQHPMLRDSLSDGADPTPGARAMAVGPQYRTPGIKNLAPRGLVILADFLDIHFRPENSPLAMDSMLNSESYTYYKSVGSAKRYYEDQSDGAYSPVFDVVGPVQLPDSVKYYGNNRAGRGTDVKAPDMVLKACSIASQMPGVDFSQYDNNNDGYLDFVYIIFAGFGESDSKNHDTLVWPASWTMAGAVSSGYTSLPSGSPQSAYTFQGKTISYFAFSPELNFYNTFYRPAPGHDADHPLRAGIGFICHEFSHVLGLPDYYDPTKGINYDQFLTPGNWDVMDVGMYNSDGYVPPAYSAHERWWMGWSAPTLLNDSMNVTMAADHESAYYITRNGTTALSTTPDTVYYLENRQLTSWDQGLPGHGLFVLRVVYNASVWLANAPNSTGGSPRYIHIPADGTYTYSYTTGVQGDDGDPFPGSANVTSCTLFPSYPITDITEQDGIVSFKFMGGTQGEALLPEQTAADGTVTAVYSLTGTCMGTSTRALPAGLYLVRKNTGKTEKIMVKD